MANDNLPGSQNQKPSFAPKCHFCGNSFCNPGAFVIAWEDMLVSPDKEK